MLQFLQPIWLWAISVIIIPLIIHLWNIKQGKVLKVGSIAFLQNSSQQYAKSFKVNEWLLLLLRCLLIILASFLLAGPIWKKPTSNKEKGWLLISKENFKLGYKTYQPLVDSLVKNGFSLHYFNERFNTTTLQDALKDSISTKENNANYWNFINQLAEQIKADLPVFVITDNQLKHFIGIRPNVENNIRWLTYSTIDSVEKHIAKAYVTSDDSIRLIIGNSSPTGNYYSIENLSKKIQSTTDLTTRLTNGNLSVKYKTDSTFLIDTAILQLTVYAAQNGNDAAYVKAAIEAIQNFTKRKINLQIAKTVQEIRPKQDWIFWLSEQPLPNNIDAKNIFAYANGKEKNTNSWINTLTANTDNTNIQSFKNTEPVRGLSSQQTIWQDGFGNPTLTKETNHQITFYYFYNRFNPAWSNLVWDNSFPTLLASIIFKDDTTGLFNDKRIIDEQQIQPVLKAPSDKKTIQLDANTTDITNLFWISIFIVFLAERLVSFRTKKADA